jgi:hypothetical protein
LRGLRVAREIEKCGPGFERLAQTWLRQVGAKVQK